MNVYEWKIMFDPSIVKGYASIYNLRFITSMYGAYASVNVWVITTMYKGYASLCLALPCIW